MTLISGLKIKSFQWSTSCFKFWSLDSYT